MKKNFTNIYTYLILLTAFPNIVRGADGGTGIISCKGGAPNCDFSDLLNTADNIFKMAVGVSVAVVAIIFAYAGWTYMTSGGDSGKVKQANKMFTNAAIGFGIVLAAFLIIELILNTLGYTGNSGSGDGTIKLF